MQRCFIHLLLLTLYLPSLLAGGTAYAAITTIAVEQVNAVALEEEQPQRHQSMDCADGHKSVSEQALVQAPDFSDHNCCDKETSLAMLDCCNAECIDCTTLTLAIINSHPRGLLAAPAYQRLHHSPTLPKPPITQAIIPPIRACLSLGYKFCSK